MSTITYDSIRSKVILIFKYKYSLKFNEEEECYTLNFDDIRNLSNLISPCSQKLENVLNEIIITLQNQGFEFLCFDNEKIECVVEPIIKCVYNEDKLKESERNRSLSFISEESSSLEAKIQDLIGGYIRDDDLRRLPFDKMFKYGQLDNIKKYLEENPEQNVSIDNMNYAASNNHVNILKWGINQNPPIVPHWTAINANNMENGLLNIAFLYYKRKLLNLDDDNNNDFSLKIQSQSAKENRLDILKWFFKYDKLVYDYVLNIAGENGHLRILKWITTNLPKNPSYPSVFDNEYIYIAAMKGYLNILKWGIKYDANLLGDDNAMIDIMNSAFVNEYHDILEWGAHRNPPILPADNIDDIKHLYI
ncbi:MAG: hypothetical protein JKX76_01755 [Colwellia sp.]|nr:hypothetical protein [Colwellia sp.]